MHKYSGQSAACLPKNTHLQQRQEKPNDLKIRYRSKIRFSLCPTVDLLLVFTIELVYFGSLEQNTVTQVVQFSSSSHTTTHTIYVI